jgi:hypothetical protein
MCLPMEKSPMLISANKLAGDKCSTGMTRCQKVWARRVKEELVKRCDCALLRSAFGKEFAIRRNVLTLRSK